MIKINFNIHVCNNLQDAYIIMCIGMHGGKMEHSNVQGKLLELTVLTTLSPTNTFAQLIIF